MSELHTQACNGATYYRVDAPCVCSAGRTRTDAERQANAVERIIEREERDEMSDHVRLNVNLNSETAAALRAIAEGRGISFTEVVRRSIAIYKYLDDEGQDGRIIQTLDQSNKNAKELVLM